MTPATNASSPMGGQGETLLQHIAYTYYEMLAAFEREIGMSRARWHTLAQLYREDQLSQAVLQQRLRVDGAAVTRQVKQLEEEGLVKRHSDPQDNRFTIVALTAKGRHLVDRLIDKRDRFEKLATEGISQEDIILMQRCLTHIRENIRTFNTKRTS